MEEVSPLPATRVIVSVATDPGLGPSGGAPDRQHGQVEVLVRQRSDQGRAVGAEGAHDLVCFVFGVAGWSRSDAFVLIRFFFFFFVRVGFGFERGRWVLPRPGGLAAKRVTPTSQLWRGNKKTRAQRDKRKGETRKKAKQAVMVSWWGIRGNGQKRGEVGRGASLLEA